MGGRSPSGRACGPTDLSRDASQPEALVPNAEERIKAILQSALDPMQTQGMGWQSFYRWMKARPAEIVERLRDSGVLFRLTEQANWPVVVETFSYEPYRTGVRMQVGIGRQTFGAQHVVPQQYLFDRDFASHLSRTLVNLVIREAAKPFEEEAYRQTAKAMEAQRAETLGSVHDSASSEGGSPNA